MRKVTVDSTLYISFWDVIDTLRERYDRASKLYAASERTDKKQLEVMASLVNIDQQLFREVTDNFKQTIKPS